MTTENELDHSNIVVEGDYPYFDNELAIAVLLRDGVCFLNERAYLFDGKESGSTTLLYANCNDVFAWGCADANDLPLDQIKPLYLLHHENTTYGSIVWACLRRNEQPQGPIKHAMIANGYWNAELEALPANTSDAIATAHLRSVVGKLKGDK